MKTIEPNLVCTLLLAVVVWVTRRANGVRDC